MNDDSDPFYAETSRDVPTYDHMYVPLYVIKT